MYYSRYNEYPISWEEFPDRIRMPTGLTRTSKITFTEDEIAAVGYIQVEDPPTADYPNKLEWSGDEWHVRPPNISEIDQQKNNIKLECQKRLQETDYRVIKSFETGISLDQSYTQYRQDLRDLFNSVDNIDIWNIRWPSPYKPVQPDADIN